MKPETRETKRYHRSEMMAILCLIAHGVNRNSFGDFSSLAADLAMLGFVWYVVWSFIFIHRGE